MSRLPTVDQFTPASGIGKIDTPTDIARMKSALLGDMQRSA